MRILLFLFAININFSILHSQSIEGDWQYAHTDNVISISETAGIATATIDHGDIIGIFKNQDGNLYSSESNRQLFMEFISEDTLVFFNIKTSKMNVFNRKKEPPSQLKEEITEAEVVSNEPIQKEATRPKEEASTQVSQEQAEETPEPEITYTYDIGDKVFWTEKETYRTGSSGNIFGDMLLGDLYNSTYYIQYVGIVESIIGDNLKIIIQDVGMDDPKYASYNYIKSKSAVFSEAQGNLGQTRIKGMDEVEPY